MSDNVESLEHAVIAFLRDGDRTPGDLLASIRSNADGLATVCMHAVLRLLGERGLHDEPSSIARNLHHLAPYFATSTTRERAKLFASLSAAYLRTEPDLFFHEVARIIYTSSEDELVAFDSLLAAFSHNASTRPIPSDQQLYLHSPSGDWTDPACGIWRANGATVEASDSSIRSVVSALVNAGVLVAQPGAQPATLETDVRRGELLWRFVNAWHTFTT